MNNIIFSDKNKVLEKIENIIKEGNLNTHILADFDRTITKAYINWNSTPSIMHIFRLNKILPENTVFYDNNLYSIYAPIEKDTNIDIDYKIKKMEEWWKRSLESLKQSWLSKYHIEEAIKI